MAAVVSAVGVSLKNILVATDFSDPARTAVRVGAALAKRYGSELWIAHVLYAPEWSVVSLPKGDVAETGHQYAFEQMQMIRREPCLSGIEHHEIIEEGDISERVEALVAERKIDLLVLGTRGTGGLAKMVIGSVAEEILRRATCPVLTIGPEVKASAAENLGVDVVLVPTDFGAVATTALPYAIALAQKERAQLVLLNVEEHLDGDSAAAEQIVKREIEHHLQQLFSPDAQLPFEPIVQVEFGDAADIIVKAAEYHHASLIVMGVRRGSELASHQPAAVLSKVLRKARCPVLTVGN
jgi:nucleotide-binding universal stress UspA family protein